MNPLSQKRSPAATSTASVAAVLLIIVLLGSQAAQGELATVLAPSLSVVPQSGPAGSQVTLMGSGYTPGGYIGTIRWDGQDVGTLFIPQGGSFTRSFTIPPGASPGAHTITVCAGSPCFTGEFEQSASAPFQVAPHTPTPTTTPTPTRTPTPTSTATATPTLGTIWGLVFEDVDQDGIWDPNEPRLAGVRIALREDPQGADIRTSVTGGNGRFEFTDVEPGTYYVVETDPPGYTSTTPNVVEVEVETGEQIEVDFGDVPEQPISTATSTSTTAPTETPTSTATPTPTATSTTACNFDPYEPNDSLSEAFQTQSGVEYQGFICPEGDHDFFKLSLTAGTRLRVQLYDLPADYQLSLYGPGGEWLDHSSSKGLIVEEIRHIAVVAGDYYFRIAPRGTAHDPTRPYTLRVTLGAPMMQVFPGMGLPGWPIRLHGQGFEPSVDQMPCVAKVYWEQETPQRFLGHTPIGADGTFNLDFSIPSDALPGTHRLRIVIVCGSASFPTQDVILFSHHEFTDDGCGVQWPPAFPDLDLTVLGMEVTQGVQCFDPTVGDTSCADNSVPLVANRPTVVRVSAQVSGVPDGVGISYVTGQLYVRREGEAEPGTPLWSTNGPIAWRAGATLDAKRQAANLTLNFRLPSEWLSERVILRLKVNPHPVCGPWESEENRANNWGDEMTIEFQERSSLRIAYLPVQVGGEGPSARVDNAWRWLYKVWPVGNPPTYTRLAGRVQVDYDLERHPQRLIRDLNRAYAGWIIATLFGAPPPPRILFGWAPAGDAPYGYSDPSWDDSVPGASVSAWYRDMSERYEMGLVHESAHNFDQHHAGVPPYWCYSGTREGQTIQEIGFDIDALEVKPADFWDAMKTGSSVVTANSWLSPCTYKGILAATPLGTRSTTNRLSERISPQEYVLIHGEVRPDHTGELEPIHRISSTVSPPIQGPRPGSDYCIELLDDADRTLHTRCFNASFVDEHSGETLESAPFLLVEHYPAETARIRLMEGQSVLDEQVVSFNAPEVTLLTPNGGEQWNGVRTITWQAGDADGDLLSYAIFYSPDDGQSWRSVATGLTEPQYDWDTTQVGGGQNARVRVVVTDGINTAFDDSDGAFQVVLKQPAASIASPADRTTFRRPEAVLLLGRGFDPEDGELRDGALVWKSDRDGFLGTGNHLVTPELSRGRHVITLTATDSDGYLATDRITIFVGFRTYLPLFLRGDQGAVSNGAAHTPAGATFTVDSTADAVDANPGDGMCATAARECTLRASVQEANALAGADTIILPAGTFTLTIPGALENIAASGDLDVTSDLAIIGAGARSTIIDGNSIDRIVEIRSGATVDIAGITIQNGNAPAQTGGGILLVGSTLTLIDSTITGNTASSGGGAYNINSSALTIIGSTISGNAADGAAFGGGGILNGDGNTLTLLNSTVSGNNSTNDGGGIWNFGSATLTNVTISDNGAANEGGGILNGRRRATLTNTIVTNSTSGGNCSGTITSGGHNLDSGNTCGFSSAGDLTSTDPLLGPLRDNGGPTQTHALLDGSPAIDAGDNTSCPATDQRAVARPVDGDDNGAATCDIGAYEYEPAVNLYLPVVLKNHP
ncbi:MAG: choice-of-anchor Q domain-containing protein [Anaerolineae bacterium]